MTGDRFLSGHSWAVVRFNPLVLYAFFLLDEFWHLHWRAFISKMSKATALTRNAINLLSRLRHTLAWMPSTVNRPWWVKLQSVKTIWTIHTCFFKLVISFFLNAKAYFRKHSGGCLQRTVFHPTSGTSYQNSPSSIFKCRSSCSEGSISSHSGELHHKSTKVRLM